jgi:hypothetical protein
VELAAFAAFAYWSASIGSGVVPVLVAVAAPALAIALLAGFGQWEAWRRPAEPRCV